MLGIQLLLEVCGAVEGRSREQCVEILKVCYPLNRVLLKLIIPQQHTATKGTQYLQHNR